MIHVGVALMYMTCVIHIEENNQVIRTRGLFSVMQIGYSDDISSE